uniref:Reverse transcriptase domain-containing protein n=1 Tax=Glossina brevipalpis TaxID=37001 RepID=A0A1A9WC42_9MUSC
MSASDLWHIAKLFRGIKSVSSPMPIQFFEELCDNLSGPCGNIMSCPSSLDESHDDFLLNKSVLSELNKALNTSKDTSPDLDGIECFLESRNNLSDYQFGFRNSKSTQDNIITTWSAINLAFMKDQTLIACFLDISSAFDLVNIDILKSTLLSLRLFNKFCNLLHGFLQYQSIVISNNDITVNRRSFTGIPQGSVLSPIRFNIYINNVFKYVPINVSILGYALMTLLFSAHILTHM